MRRSARASHVDRVVPTGSPLAAIYLALALLAGCAGSGPSLGWIDETLYGTRAAGPAQAAYTGVDRVKVYGEPDASSPVQGVLSLHEKVTRYQSERGYAYVEAAGNVAGWVREQQLVASRPQAPKAPVQAPPAPPEPSATTAEPSGTTTTESTATTPTEPDAEPAPAEEPPAPDEGPGSSVFDPY